MNYKNGKDILPTELLDEIQKYISGEMIYIPKRTNSKARWGQLSGMRHQVNSRNTEIRESYRNGVSVNELTESFCLSESSIKKIIYNSR